MSYLEAPRIHFSGRFQADTSTVNNDVRHYDSSRFQPHFQKPMVVKDENIVLWNGYWNPNGSGAWRMLGCRVTGAVLGNQHFTQPSQDPVVGLVLSDAVDRVAGKLVDLDPQQQMVSQIWGLQIRLQDPAGNPAMVGEFVASPFCDIWLRQQNVDQWLDQQLAAAYQSILAGVQWSNVDASPTLKALRAASDTGMLSIRMNVFGYDRTPGAPDYGTGVVVGTIGPARASEPKHFALGRHMTPKSDESSTFVPANKISNIQAVVHGSQPVLSVDLGNALPTTDSIGTLENLGQLSLAVLKDGSIQQGAFLTEDQYQTLAEVNYLDSKGWYYQTAGIVDVALDEAQAGLIKDHPIAVLLATRTGPQVLNRETADGVFVRADMFVFRLNPGQDAGIHFYATRYGSPTAMALTAVSDAGMMGGAGTGAKLDIPIPDVNQPSGVVTYDNGLTTGPDGAGVLTIRASAQGAGNPRQYLDGQLYGIKYGPKDPPADLQTNPTNYVSILAWNLFDVPEQPTWTEHIQPILTQYGNLYPIMSQRLVDLGDYDSVVANLDIMKLSFSLPRHNPNHMPVTRDLSANKTATILKWLDSRDPKTGLPPYGPAVATLAAPAPVVEAETNEPDPGGKVAFVRASLKKDKT